MEQQSQDKNGIKIILQNELMNTITSLMDKYCLSERDMMFVLQGVQLKVTEMAMTRICYFNIQQDEIMSKLIKQKGDENDKVDSGEED